MTNEELDKARVKEAQRLFLDGSDESPTILIAARLAREGWTPPVPVDPDLVEARRMAGSIYSGSRFEKDCIAGKRDTSPDVVTMLAGIKLGRALAAEAKPGMVWVKHDGSAECPVDPKQRVCLLLPSGHVMAGEAGPASWRTVAYYLVLKRPLEMMA